MAQTPPPSPALVSVPAKEVPALRLFAFPHAGSGAFPYRALAAGLPPWVELHAVQLPGRESLFSVTPYRSMPPLVEALVPVLAPKLDLPFVFFGHSFGGHVAFAMARSLRARGAATPRALVVSSSRAPHLPLGRMPLHDLPRPRLIEELRRYGGTPEAVLSNAELMDLFLPPLCADLRIYETNTFEPEAPLALPITAFGGRQDLSTRAEQIEPWREHTSAAFTSRMFEGGHFYLFEQSKPVFLEALRQVFVDCRGAQGTS
ncbi:alpha/beta fold hydrolase [Polyangium sp. 15x6]|uniref:thioesterase II family protein n=1 Tax=Polyangium sp. 15x6 TaxID=3042687 RepID=UPI00249C1B8A|nr:alpha/beta fold hydrolase [Polyangium sp. 15x6]MDI3285920.1 thioesterase domain-containing protein [Polyangium sp. 15x6]